MADRPIIFSTPMVRALMDGRKSMTRRVLKPWPGFQAGWLSMETLHRAPTCYLAEVDGRLGAQMQHPLAGQHGNDAMSPLSWVRLPYAPGDRLYVREAWSGPWGCRQLPPRDWPVGCPTWYWADGNPDYGDWTKPKPSIHMPRWASRLTLIVTDVRVQRLQEISEGDARAEGCAGWAMGDYESRTPIGEFRDLWNSLHSPDAWAQNPWVAALTFTVHHCNIDQMEG